jgi:hypothetical protein
LSQAQQDNVTFVLSRFDSLTTDIKSSIAESERTVSTQIASQGTRIEQCLQQLRVGVSDGLSNTEVRVISHLDAQDRVASEVAARQTKVHDEEAWQKRKNRLLDALDFPEMNERHKMVSNRVEDFGRTFRWIFKSSKTGNAKDQEKTDISMAHWRNNDHEDDEVDDSEDDEDADFEDYEDNSFDNRDDDDDLRRPETGVFVDWLQDDRSLFWIRGKPGSGKSTLMNYILRNIQLGTEASTCLSQWTGGQPFHILHFWFFRPSASSIANSFEGLLRSLCYQLLMADSQLCDDLLGRDCQWTPVAVMDFINGSSHRSLHWTHADLRTLFFGMLTRSKQKVFMLLDGLDEVTQNRDTLLNLVLSVAHVSTTTKICCSSRPESPFRNALKSYSSLSLQEFNHRDIERYCKDQLEETRVAALARDISWKAEGVFLWAALVVSDLKAGVDQGDSDEALDLRLQDCPTEMNDLLAHLVERQDKFYRKYPRPYLRLVSTATKRDWYISLLELHLAGQADAQTRLESCLLSNIGWETLHASLPSLDGFRRNLTAHCANLVECYAQDRRTDSLSSSYTNFAEADRIAVRFIHRSVQDFLADTEHGKAILNSCHVSQEQACQLLMTTNILIAQLDSWAGRDEHPSHFYRNQLHMPFRYVSKSPDRDHPSDINLIDAHLTAIQQKISRTGIALGEFLRPRSGLSVRIAPRLSGLENLILYVSSYHCLGPYLSRHLTTWDAGTLDLAILVVMLQLSNLMLLGQASREECEQLDAAFVEALCFLDWKQRPDISYHREDSLKVVVSSPIIDHLEAATMWNRSLFGERLGKEGFLSHCDANINMMNSVLRLLKRLRPRVDVPIERPRLATGYLILPPSPHHYYRPFVVPCSSKTGDNEELNTQLTLTRWFDIQWPVRRVESAKGQLYSFQGYSPVGFSYAMDIDETHVEMLQGVHLGDFSDQHIITLELELLNAHIDELSPVDIAHMLYVYPNKYHHAVAFSDHKFKFSPEFDVEAWTLRLSQGSFEEDFGPNAENDPILHAILHEFKHEPVTYYQKGAVTDLDVGVFSESEAVDTDILHNDDHGKAKQAGRSHPEDHAGDQEPLPAAPL